MKRFGIVIYCCLLFFGCATKVVRGQAPEKQAETWVELLRNDPRLEAEVSYQFEPRPTAEQVLASVQKATGVPLSVAGQRKLIFGTTDASNVPAWVVMEALAAAQVVDGKWEKAGDGYVLHGKQFDFEGTGPPATFPWAWAAIDWP